MLLWTVAALGALPQCAGCDWFAVLTLWGFRPQQGKVIRVRKALGVEMEPIEMYQKHTKEQFVPLLGEELVDVGVGSRPVPSASHEHVLPGPTEDVVLTTISVCSGDRHGLSGVPFSSCCACRTATRRAPEGQTN